MSDRNVVGIMFKSQEDFLNIKQIIGSIYDTMNHSSGPIIEQTENHVVGKVDIELIALVENSVSNFFQ